MKILDVIFISLVLLGVFIAGKTIADNMPSQTQIYKIIK